MIFMTMLKKGELTAEHAEAAESAADAENL